MGLYCQTVAKTADFHAKEDCPNRGSAPTSDARPRLLRLVVEKVRVSGWRVEIHLKIPLGDDPGSERESRPKPGPGPSSDMGLRSADLPQGRQLPASRQGPRLAAPRRLR